MTKQQIIDRHGLAYYEEQKAKNRAAALARYWSDPALHRKTPEENKAARERYLAKPENVQKSRDSTRKYTTASRAADPEKWKAKWHKAYLAKMERFSQDEEALAAFKASAKARHDAWRDANREHVNAYSRAAAAANPEYRRTIAIAMAHRRRGAGPMDREFVQWLRTQPCVDCGSTERIEVGHIVSVKCGGSNDSSNLIPQCRPCNRRLSSKPHRRALDSG